VLDAEGCSFGHSGVEDRGSESASGCSSGCSGVDDRGRGLAAGYSWSYAIKNDLLVHAVESQEFLKMQHCTLETIPRIQHSFFATMNSILQLLQRFLIPFPQFLSSEVSGESQTFYLAIPSLDLRTLGNSLPEPSRFLISV